MLEKIRPLRLFPLLLGGLAVIAAQVSAQAPADTLISAADFEEPRSRPASPKHETPSVMGVQLLTGAGVGVVAGLGTLALIMGSSGCGDEKKDTGPSDEEDYPSEDWSCLGPALVGLFVGSGVYVVGSSVGVHAAGRLMDREGSYLATLLGASLGAIGGAYMASKLDGGEGINATAFLLLTQVGAIGMYHMTDRVRLSATLESAPRLAEGQTGSIGKRVAIRPECKVVLARF